MRFQLLLIALAGFIGLYAIVISPLSGILKFVLGVVEMFVLGQLLISRYKLTGEWGLILLRSQRGISFIHQIAKHEEIWKFFSDTGIVLSYGLLSLVLMRRHVSVKSLALGLVLLAAIFFLVMPSALLFLASTIGVTMMDKSAQQFAGIGNIASSFLILVFLGGFFGILLAGLLTYSTVVILPNLLSTLLYGTNAIGETTPGGTLLLPGINIPFFEGILALLIILAVHEGAHAVLARIARIPILSSGLVLFGVVPIGAFVEPDEERLKKLEQVRQTRVLVAGSTANLLTSIVFFVIFIAFVAGTQAIGLWGTPLLPVMKFMTALLGLTFALNFVVGTVNLLPLPFFDGYRALEINIAHKPVLQFLSALTLVAFLLNFLPWLFV